MGILHENRALDIFDPLNGKARRIRMDDPLDWLLDEGATEPFVLRQDSRGTYRYVSHDLRRIRHFTSQKPQPIPVSNPRKEKIIALRSAEHTSELQPLMRTPYAVFSLKTKNR